MRDNLFTNYFEIVPFINCAFVDDCVNSALDSAYSLLFGIVGVIFLLALVFVLFHFRKRGDLNLPLVAKLDDVMDLVGLVESGQAQI